MKLKVALGDKEAEVQVVKRKNTVYYREYNEKEPTPPQKNVRDNFTEYAHKARGKSREEVNESVKNGFKNYDRIEKLKENKTYQLLKLMYPDEADKILEFFK